MMQPQQQPVPQQYCSQCQGRGSKFFRSANGQEFLIRCSACHGTGVIPQQPQQVTITELLNRFGQKVF